MLNYEILKTRIKEIEYLASKNNNEKAIKYYLNLKQELKTFLNNLFQTLIELMENKNKIILESIYHLIYPIWRDEEDFLFNKKITTYDEKINKYIEQDVESKISKILKQINYDDSIFWEKLEDVFNDIITIIDFIENRKFLNQYKYLERVKEQIQTL